MGRAKYRKIIHNSWSRKDNALRIFYTERERRLFFYNAVQHRPEGITLFRNIRFRPVRSTRNYQQDDKRPCIWSWTIASRTLKRITVDYIVELFLLFAFSAFKTPFIFCTDQHLYPSWHILFKTFALLGCCAVYVVQGYSKWLSGF